MLGFVNIAAVFGISHVSIVWFVVSVFVMVLAFCSFFVYSYVAHHPSPRRIAVPNRMPFPTMFDEDFEKLSPKDQRAYLKAKREYYRVRREMSPNTVAVLSLIVAVLSLISSTVLGILALHRR